MAVTDRIPETDEREPYTSSGSSSRLADSITRNLCVFIKKICVSFGFWTLRGGRCWFFLLWPGNCHFVYSATCSQCTRVSWIHREAFGRTDIPAGIADHTAHPVNLPCLLFYFNADCSCRAFTLAGTACNAVCGIDHDMSTGCGCPFCGPDGIHQRCRA